MCPSRLRPNESLQRTGAVSGRWRLPSRSRKNRWVSHLRACSLTLAFARHGLPIPRSHSVYELRAGTATRALCCRREGEYRRVWELGGQPIEPDRWTPLEVQLIRDGSAGTAPGDLVMLGVEPAFTSRAVEALQDVLFPAGQILPLRSPDGEFYLWNVTRMLDALDENASALTRFDSSEKIMSVQRWAFKADVVADAVAFKIPQLPRAFTFVDDTFLKRVKEERLLGFAPRAVWTAGHK
jgi:hypothetical protein